MIDCAELSLIWSLIFGSVNALLAQDDSRLALRYLEQQPIAVRSIVHFEATAAGSNLAQSARPVIGAPGCKVENMVVSPDNKHCVFDLEAPNHPLQRQGDLTIALADSSGVSQDRIFDSPLRFYEEGGVSVGDHDLADRRVHVTGGVSIDFVPPIKPRFSGEIAVFATSESFQGVPLGEKIRIWAMTPRRRADLQFVGAGCSVGRCEVAYNQLATERVLQLNYFPWDQSGLMKAGVHTISVHFREVRGDHRHITKFVKVEIMPDGVTRVIAPTIELPPADNLPRYDSPYKWKDAMTFRTTTQSRTP